MRYISESQSLPGEKDSKDTQKVQSRETDIELKNEAVKRCKHDRKQQILQMVTLICIKVDKELFVNYCTQYSFD